MSVDVLGDRVDDNVGTELERVLEEGRHEGVVDNELGVVLVGNLGNGLDVDETEGRVGGGLDPDELGVGADGLGNVGSILEVDKGDLDVEGVGDLGEVAVGASVDVVDGDDVGAGGQGADDGGGGGRSGGEGKTVLATLQGSDGGLEGLAGGVSRAGVVKALFERDVQ